ncbi:hypothetical protein TKK_0016409 [Trichogramma kaykai]
MEVRAGRQIAAGGVLLLGAESLRIEFDGIGAGVGVAVQLRDLDADAHAPRNLVAVDHDVLLELPVDGWVVATTAGPRRRSPRSNRASYKKN